jgi:hypothetical protein
MRSIRPTAPPGGKSSPAAVRALAYARGPPGRRPRRVRIFVELPEEPPELTPAAARTLLSILQKAADKQKREADGKS